ncbi:MAG: ABC-type sugar transport system, ATPase component, partial [Pedosphaera sp.]|nr:ABC-type sugar transport system, ATPase component [Pedosphaera sp.]
FRSTRRIHETILIHGIIGDRWSDLFQRLLQPFSQATSPQARMTATRLDGEVLLRMQDISKRFGPVQALSDVTFSVRRGTVHALCGENGAGKSTLMKILAGVHQPDAGTIEMSGRPCRFGAPVDALAAGISMIYQELDLAEDLTVAENIFLGSEPRGLLPFTIDRRAMFTQTQGLAGQYGFTIDAHAIVADLSTGDCQIVELLKALRRRSAIIVMDEPTSSLSEAEAQRLFSVVRQLRERGLSIVYISHRLEEVVDLADDISILRDGKVVHSAPAAQLNIAAIVHHMVGRELNEFFPAKEAEIGKVRVEVKNLSSREGIRDVSFEVRGGEIVGLAGLMGSGRTEIARALFGVQPKTSGEVWLDEVPVEIKSPADAIGRGMALLTEDRKRTGLCVGLPCFWNVTLPNLRVLGMKFFIQPAKEAATAARVGSQMNVKWASPHAPAGSLSGGNQQKLLVARWLLAGSRFMIFDEPTRGIDVGAKREIYTLLNALAKEGKAILFISSELPELFGVADRILVMRRGKLVGNLVTKETNPNEVMHLAAVV